MKIVLAPKGASKAGLMCVGVFQGDKELSAGIKLETAFRERVRREMKEKRFEGKPGDSLLVSTEKTSYYFAGLGKDDKHTLEKVRRVAARFLGQAKGLRVPVVRVELEALSRGLTMSDAARAVVEGVRLSDYKFEKYKSKPAPAFKPDAVEIASPAAESRLREAIAEAEAVSDAVNFTRTLANEPANFMTPVRLAQAAREMASKNGLSCKILGKEEIKRLKMGGVMGVSQGSSFPPQFIVLENRVKSSARPIVLVGKGVTFDTGGISIKPAGDMDKMRYDMSGAAAVIGAMKAIANLKLNVPVVGLCPVVENMPGPTAQRPGDILTIMNGKTVEVLNTDAEGRLILADALAYAKRYEPRAIVDIATLTGAAAVTFNDVCSAVMGTDPELVRRLIDAGNRTGERLWELPLWDEYFESIRATYADIQNISKKYAGTITAGMFLKEFADHTKSWAHLDVAGTAWADSPKPLFAVGSTGVGVRLFVEFVKSYL